MDNVIQANQLAALASKPEAINTVYNVACGERTDLNQLVAILRESLAQYDLRIAEVEATHGSNREGDIPHSLADIGKARKLLGYDPQFGFSEGIKAAAEWYFKNLEAPR